MYMYIYINTNMYQNPPPIGFRKVGEPKMAGWQKVHPKMCESFRTWYKMKIRTSVFHIQGEDLGIQTEIMNNNFFLQYKRWRETETRRTSSQVRWGSCWNMARKIEHALAYKAPTVLGSVLIKSSFMVLCKTCFLYETLGESGFWPKIERGKKY